MYLRSHHVETSLPILRQLIRSHPLGIFTTAIPSTQHPLIQSSHIPWLLDLDDETSSTELGKLRGHMARANPQCKAIIDSLSAAPSGANGDVLEQEVLVLFNSPVQHYVTPKFYVETKPATGKVVPTWNYAAVQVYGKARIFWDAKRDNTGAFLQKQVEDLSKYAETSIMGYTGQDGSKKAWEVADAPDSYVGLLKKAIIGIEIEISRMEGKFKMTQEMGNGDRQGVIEGFQNLGTEVGKEVADMVKWRGELKDEALAKAKEEKEKA
jgi:transcriptional regulator